MFYNSTHECFVGIKQYLNHHQQLNTTSICKLIFLAYCSIRQTKRQTKSHSYQLTHATTTVTLISSQIQPLWLKKQMSTTLLTQSLPRIAQQTLLKHDGDVLKVWAWHVNYLINRVFRYSVCKFCCTVLWFRINIEFLLNTGIPSTPTTNLPTCTSKKY